MALETFALNILIIYLIYKDLLQLIFIIYSGSGTAWGHRVQWIIWTGSSCKCRSKCGYFDSKSRCSGSVGNSVNMPGFSCTSVCWWWWVYYYCSCAERLFPGARSTATI